MEKEDFRIAEYQDKFIIEQRIDYFESFFARLFLVPKEKWIVYDNNICFQDIILDPKIKAGYDSLEEATKKLEKILEKPKYHYLQ